MQLTKCVRLDHVLLVLYSLTAVSPAQSVSTLSNGCYITSSVIYGNITGSSTVTTASQSQSIIATSSPVTTSSVSNGASSPSSSPTSSFLNPSGTTSPTLPTTTASSPTSSPFVIAVTGFGSKLRARALEFVTFSGNNAYLSPYEDLAAVFVLTVDGQLQVGNASVGTNGNTGTLPLMQFSGPTQPSGYIWSFNGTRLVFGDTTFSAIADGQLSAVFPGSQPPEGTVQVGMAAEFVDISASSSSIATSTSTSSSSVESTSTTVTITSTAEQQTSETTQQTSGSVLTTNQASSLVTSTGSSSSSYIATTTTTTTTIETTSASSQTTQITYISTCTSSSLEPSTSTAPVSHSSAQSPSSILSSTPQPATSSSYQLSLSVVTSSTTVPNGFTSSSSSQTTNIQTSLTTSLSRMSSVTTTGSASSSGLTSTRSSVVAPASSTSMLSFSNSASPSQSTSLSSSSTKSTTTVTGQISQSTTNSPSGQTTVSSTWISSTSTTITTTSRTSSTNPHTSLTSSTSSASTTSSSSLAPSTSSSSPIPTPYPAKRGLVYTNVTTLQFYPPPSPYISWSYNYYSLPNASDNVGPYPSSQYRFIPLLYNDADSLTSIWSANVNFSIANYGTDAIFGFNEPDASYNGESANMPVAESIQGYQNFMQPFAGRVKIGAPAVTNTGGGLTYLAQFLGNATQLNLTIDFLNIHWYASPYNIDYFQSYLVQAYNLSLSYFPAAPVPVWVTEFGMDQDNYDQATTVQFLQNASRWMDDQLWVDRYAWFGNFAGGYTSSGAPTTDMLLNVDGSALGVLGEVWYTYNGTS